MNILSVASLVFVLNLPFGYWRENERKFSTRWFLSVHAPVPFVIALRLLSGLGWQFTTFPIVIGAFFGGQFAGGSTACAKTGPDHGSAPASSGIWSAVIKNSIRQ